MVNINKTNVISTVVLVIVLISVGLFFPQFLGLSKAGFEDPQILEKFQFYSNTAIGFLVGLIFVYLVELLVRKGDKSYGDSVLFNAPGEKPALPFFKRFSTLQLTLFFLIIWTVLAFASQSLQMETFTGVGTLGQQFTPIDSILFSTVLVTISENLGAGFFMAVILAGIRLYARKTDMSSNSFVLISRFLLPILVGIYGLSVHLMRYAGFDTSLTVVFIFWFIGGLITVLTGSFMPFLTMHIANNFFYSLSESFSSDIVQNTAFIGIAILIGLYFLIYKNKLFGKKS